MIMVHVVDNADMKEVRKVWQATHDAKLTLQKLGKRNGVERHLLMGIAKNGSDSCASIQNVCIYARPPKCFHML